MKLFYALAASAIAAVLFGSPPKRQPVQEPAPEVVEPQSPPVASRQIGIPPVPPPFPASFRIQFTTSIGEVIDVRTSFFTNDANGMTWYTHYFPMSYDKQISPNVPVAPKQWSAGMRLVLKDNAWVLHMGRQYVFDLDTQAVPFTGSFNVGFTDVGYGSILYTNITATP